MPTTVDDRSLSGNDISVYMSEQTTKGAIDATPAFDRFRRTEGKPKKEIAYAQSGEVKTNRQGRTQVQDTTTFTGEPAFELTQSTAPYFDAMIHGAAATNTVTAVATIGTDAAGFVSSNNDFANFSVGDWFKASGFTDPDLNILYKISAKTDSNNIDTTVAPV